MLKRLPGLVAFCGLSLFAPAAAAQFNNTWLTFSKDNTRIVDANGASAGYILNDPDEKDYAFGDVNHDGWTDLVVVRKEPATTVGKRVNYLLMNENGKLVDRSAQYASDTNVPGDLGFLTATNDRDVQVADLNGDGWEDIVTATTLSQSDPKVLSHPRIYINKGTVGGVWQGFRYEAARIPQLTTIPGGAPLAPNFCSVSVGDVTGDGSPDLYFANYNLSAVGMADRLLVNDGAGNFIDSLETRMSASMLASGFGTSSEIVDLNGDGTRDVVRGQSGGAECSYNNPLNPGYFNIFQTNVGSSSTYHVDAGDLNADGKPDLVFSDDGLDFYRYNTGNDALGRAIFGPVRVYSFLTGGDDGFAGNCMVVDLNDDGFGDALYSDFDVDEAGCGRRAKIYHNLGGAIGSQPTLREEVQQVVGGWKGAVGILESDLIGTYDIAAFDIDNDGDKDLVIGRCAGTSVFMNQMLQPSTIACAGDGSATACPCGNASASGSGAGCLSSLASGGKLRSTGAARTSSDGLALLATQVPNGPGLYFQGTSLMNGGLGITFGDGLLCAGGTITRLGVVFASGAASQYPRTGIDPRLSLQGAVNAGDVKTYQVWYRDADVSFCSSSVFNLTNALSVAWQ
jgi:hypothetical protein